MKKTMAALAAWLVLAGLLTGCGAAAGDGRVSGQPQNTQGEAESTPPVPSGPQVALSAEPAASAGPESDQGGARKTLVVFYSATGNTGRVAGVIAAAAGADIFELVPVDPYTEDDLNWRDTDSRCAREYADPGARAVALTAAEVDNWEEYDRVFIGYPIWWGSAAWPVDTFVQSNDFTGKTVIPFCTSSSSGLGDSGALLAELAGAGDWLEGVRFGSHVSDADVRAWVDGLE